MKVPRRIKIYEAVYLKGTSIMALSVKQTHMILQLLSNRLSGERDVIKISQILKEFEAAFIVDIPTWRYDLAEYLKKELYGNTALGVLKQWQ